MRARNLLSAVKRIYARSQYFIRARATEFLNFLHLILYNIQIKCEYMLK